MEQKIDSLDKSIKATRSIKELFDNGPLMAILSIQFVLILIVGYLYIAAMNETKSVQAQLYEQIIERTDKAVNLKVTEQLAPITEDAKVTIHKLDSTRKVIDNASKELEKIINKKN